MLDKMLILLKVSTFCHVKQAVDLFKKCSNICWINDP